MKRLIAISVALLMPLVAYAQNTKINATTQVQGTVPTSSLPGSGAVTINTQSLTLGNSLLTYAAGGGTAQAQTVTLSPAAGSLTPGLTIYWLPTAANTGSGPTLAVNGLTATTITKCGTTALAANDLTTTAVAHAIYDGTEFQLLNPQAAGCGSAGGSNSWSSLTNPSANLSLNLSSFNSTFTFGTTGPTIAFSSTNSGLVLNSSVAATVSAVPTPAVLDPEAQYWNGSATATDQWFMYDLCGTGSNPECNLAIGKGSGTTNAANRVEFQLQSTSGGNQWAVGYPTSLGAVTGGDCVEWNASAQNTVKDAGFQCGTVTSVGLSLPSILTVSGSPVTSSGTLSAAYATGLTSNENQVLSVNGSGIVGLNQLTPAMLGSTPTNNYFLEDISGTPTWAAVSGGGPGTGTTDASTYWSSTSALGSVTPPTTNGFYFLGQNVTASAAVPPTATLSTSLPDGFAIGSSDTGTPSMTFGSNSITFNQPVTISGTTHGITIPFGTAVAVAANDLELVPPATGQAAGLQLLFPGTETAADSLIVWGAAATHVQTGTLTAIGSCSGASNALIYNTTTHAFGCNTLSGAVSSVSNSDGTLTISPTTGAVIASLALGHANTWTALQTFGTNISIGGVTAAGATGTGNVVFATSPTLTTPNLGTPSAINLTNATSLPCGALPALTGAVTTSAGACATTVNPTLTFGTQNTTAGAPTLAGSASAGGSLTLNGIGASPGSSVLSVNTAGTTLNLGSTNATITTAGALTVTSCTGCAGSSTVFQTNGTTLTSSATVNFENSAATNGLTLTFSNPSAGNVQLGLSGTLNNSGLTNTGTTVNGNTCTLGSTCTVTLDQIGNPAASKTFTFAATNTLTLAGTAPASSASAGTAAGTLLSIPGVTGGATTGSATTAGTGSAISFSAGVGGSGSGGTNAIGGAGGGITFTSGNGGASGGTAANANGGGFTFTAGSAGTGGSGPAGSMGAWILNQPITNAITNSPLQELAGEYQSGTSTFASDTWSEQDVIGAGTNGTSTLTFTHSGSTGAAGVSFPGAITSGTWNGTAIGSAYGGTGISTSSSSGIAQVASGTWSVSTTLPSGLSATNMILTTPALGTPSALVLTNASGLPCSALPALTGDTTTTAGACATTTAKINGTAFSGTANDVVAFGTGGTIPLDSGVLYTNLVTDTTTPAANQLAVFGSTSKVVTPTTTLPTAAEPAHTGDVTNTTGSLAMTVGQIEGAAIPASATIVGTNSSKQLVSVTTTGSGNAVLATSPSLTTPSLGVATATSLVASGIVDGQAPVTVTTGSSATLGGTYKSGYTFNEEATAGTAVTYTLPTAAAGLQYCVKNAYNGSAANTGSLELLTSASGQFIIFTDGTLSASGGYVISGGAAADSACVVGVDSTHWILYVSSGTWTKH